MRPEDVRFHHIRDWNWPQKWCPKCFRMVPTFHQHYKKGKGDIPAIPQVKDKTQARE